MTENKMGMRIGESVFCIAYLLFDLIAGILFWTHGEQRVFLLYGIMTLLLGGGDAFHLIPRVVKQIRGDSEQVRRWMDIGLAVTSVTMTVFYILLFYIWKELNPTRAIANAAAIVVWITALARIVICFLPQNRWLQGGNKTLSIWRNTVFAITGAVEVVLFWISGGGFGIAMACSITCSFLFYFPVTLYAKEHPKVGMLMIPKTIMYILMISLGLSMMG